MHARELLLVEVVLGGHRLRRLPEQYLGGDALAIHFHVNDLAVPGEELAQVIIRELVLGRAAVKQALKPAFPKSLSTVSRAPAATCVSWRA